MSYIASWQEERRKAIEKAREALGELAPLGKRIKEVFKSFRRGQNEPDIHEQYALAVALSKAIREREGRRRSSFVRLNLLIIAPIKRAFGFGLESVDTENLSGRQELLELFETYINADLLTWLLDLPFNLAKRGMVREAADLGLAWSEITKAENFLGDRTVILAEAGLEKEARRQIRQNLKKFPDDVWIKIKAGEAYEELGDTRAAELQYRRSLDITESGYDRAGVLERLIPLLSETGKEAEARALEVEERRYEFEEQEEEEEETSTWMTDMSREPKVGRNEPCPCGSGKKYKKCCLNKAGKEEISSSV